MKKADLVAAIAEKTGVSKAEALRVFDATFETVKEALVKGNNVAVPGFGTFKVAERAAREGINPLTKKAIKIPAKKAVSFKAGSALKDEMNK